MEELNQRRKNYSEYIKENIGKVNFPFTEENYQIIYDEATRLKEEALELTATIDELKHKNF